MRLLMTPAQVTLAADQRPKTVAWSTPRSEPTPAKPPEPGQAPTPSRPAEAPSPGPAPEPPTAPAPHRRNRPTRPRYVVHVLDAWRYDGRWWEEHELHRDYYFLELDGGTRLELFREGEGWWAARTND